MALWPALVAAAPGATPPATLPDGWTPASTQLWLSPPADVDPRMPRAVTFDVDMSADPTGAAVVFLAVVMSSSNQIGDYDRSMGSAGQALSADQLVTTSAHAAARSVELT